MTDAAMDNTGFLRTVWLLLATARRRAVGRQRRQAELLGQRSGKATAGWAGIGFILIALAMCGLNITCAFLVSNAVIAAERSDAEAAGAILVDAQFIAKVNKVERQAEDEGWTRHDLDRALAHSYRSEARRISQAYGGDEIPIAKRLRQAVRDNGSLDLRDIKAAAPGLTALPRAGALPSVFGSIVLVLWSLMLVFQGEGLDLDTQRRRHPMWEFLFSHPVPYGAVFLAEMLSPLAANPFFYSAPLFAGFLYGFVYGPGYGILAVLAVGIPVTVAASCLGKALEIAVLLRFSARSRGAMIGLMGWLGYATMMVLILCAFASGSIVTASAPALHKLTALPWPWLGLFLGRWGNGFSFPVGAATCWSVAGVVVAISIRFSIWGAEKGLASPAERLATQPGTRRGDDAGFGKWGLYRKEILWLLRDRSAIVQAFLIPLTMASMQLFNMRGLLSHAQTEWNFLCGAGILFGIYFISVLGPKSLASEGRALWLSLTWPHGLEDLLRAKAWLWSLISTAMVVPVLCYATILFPASFWKIALVGIGWYLFARSLAEKNVTLATVTSESGEVQKLPYGRRWAAQLGTFTFSIGVITQQWSVAVAGIVYSIMTSAAMWQNFRARLPYLYDPWSETLPAPPTLMHAMVAISILVECGTIFTAVPTAFASKDTAAFVRAISYGLWAIIVAVLVAGFLERRDVRHRDVWQWPRDDDALFGRRGWRRLARPGRHGPVVTVILGAGCGVALGLLGLVYLAALRHWPEAADILTRSDAAMAAIPHAREGFFIMAVLVAPFAEEYLFRGLLYRALDHEWGGWRAVAGSAAFFAVYHPLLAWLPVGTLGVANALIFKSTGRLLPAVALHMAYNAVVLTL